MSDSNKMHLKSEEKMEKEIVKKCEQLTITPTDASKTTGKALEAEQTSTNSKGDRDSSTDSVEDKRKEDTPQLEKKVERTEKQETTENVEGKKNDSNVTTKNRQATITDASKTDGKGLEAEQKSADSKAAKDSSGDSVEYKRKKVSPQLEKEVAKTEKQEVTEKMETKKNDSIATSNSGQVPITDASKTDGNGLEEEQNSTNSNATKGPSVVSVEDNVKEDTEKHEVTEKMEAKKNDSSVSSNDGKASGSVSGELGNGREVLKREPARREPDHGLLKSAEVTVKSAECAKTLEEAKQEKIVHGEQEDLSYMFECYADELEAGAFESRAGDLASTSGSLELASSTRTGQVEKNKENKRSHDDQKPRGSWSKTGSSNSSGKQYRKINTVSNYWKAPVPERKISHKTPTAQYKVQKAVEFRDATEAMEFVKANPEQNLFVDGHVECSRPRRFILRAALEMAARGKQVLLTANQHYESDVKMIEEMMKNEDMPAVVKQKGFIFNAKDFEVKQSKGKSWFGKNFKNLQIIIIRWGEGAYMKYVKGLISDGQKFVPDVVVIDSLNYTTPAFLELNMITQPKQIIASFEQGRRGNIGVSTHPSAVTEFIFGKEDRPRKDINYLYL